MATRSKSTPPATAKALSLHVGLNLVSAAAYLIFAHAGRAGCCLRQFWETQARDM